MNGLSQISVYFSKKIRHFRAINVKLLEHNVCSNIMAHLDEYKLLSDRQHAFKKIQCAIISRLWL